jgi:16S rRNA (cytosine1402-N4)-methyltransferase
MGGDVGVHVPVMPEESLAGLAIRPDGAYLDGTYGRGGHAAAILARLGPAGRLMVMDKDPAAIATARVRHGDDPRVAIRHASFADLADWDATAAGLDGVLFDLGVSSPQLDDGGRGFSFQHDGPLDMRMDTAAGPTAADFIATADEAEIADVLWRHGEERQSRRIARAIVARRAEGPIATTRELAELVASVIGRGEPGKHPATRSFQALRIHVNAELDDLARGLEAATARLNGGGRLVVIAFHSLEDRIVKQFIRTRARQAPGSRRLPPAAARILTLREIGGAQRPGDAELAVNPRARSAVLRVAERAA